MWKPEGEAEGALRLNLWDFGGQEVYHATHTFFLTERAVYVVVVNARDNDNQNNIEYWLQMARSFGGGASIIVAVNKCDQHNDGPDENLLRRKYGVDLRFIRTSCWTGTGLEKLKSAICHCVNADPEVRRDMPATWLQIKNALEDMTQETLPLADYRELCVKHGETDEKNQDLLLNLWHKLGAVLYFHHSPEDSYLFRDLGILNPEWVTKGVYSVLDDASLRERNGLLTSALLEKALKDAHYTGSNPHFIEAMMRKFDLLYDDPDRKTMLVPRLMEENEPKLDAPSKDALRFVYQYEVLPAGLLARFIVRWHKDLASAPKPWRHGCVLAMLGCRVLVRSDKERKTVEILVDGPPVQRREALDRVRHIFEDIHGAFKSLPVEEFIPVPGRPDAPLLKYNYLRSLEWNGRTQLDADGATIGEIINVDVAEELGTVRTEARRNAEQAIHNRYYINHAEHVEGVGMSKTINTHIGGSFAGNFSAIAGDKNKVKQDSTVTQEVEELAKDPAQIQAKLDELRALIEQARTAGASKSKCDLAVESVAELATAIEKPTEEATKKTVEEATGFLVNIANSFKSFSDIGENFEKILKLVVPAIGTLIQHSGLVF